MRGGADRRREVELELRGAARSRDARARVGEVVKRLDEEVPELAAAGASALRAVCDNVGCQAVAGGHPKNEVERHRIDLVAVAAELEGEPPRAHRVLGIGEEAQRFGRGGDGIDPPMVQLELKQAGLLAQQTAQLDRHRRRSMHGTLARLPPAAE